MTCVKRRGGDQLFSLQSLVVLLYWILTGASVAIVSDDVSADGGFVQSDGQQIFYQQYGQGYPLILVHGWGADSRSNWFDNGWVDALVAQRRVITIDIRGHGRSDKPHALEPYSYAAMSGDVLAVMAALDIEQADFMGYSMGAFIGAYLLGHHAPLFRCMVLGGIGDETAQSAAQGQVIADALRAKHIAADRNDYGAQVRRFVAANPHNDLQALAWSALKMWPEGFPLKIAGAGVSGTTMPVLIVNGADDHPYVDTADQLAAALKNARYLEIPGTDHLSVVSDERFRHAVTGFLRQQ